MLIIRGAAAGQHATPPADRTHAGRTLCRRPAAPCGLLHIRFPPLTNGFLEVALEVPACPSRVRGLDVVGVEGQHSTEVADGLVELPQLLIDSAPIVQCINIARLKLQDCVVVCQRGLQAACREAQHSRPGMGLGQVGAIVSRCEPPC